MSSVLHAHDPFISAILQSIDDHAVFTVDHAGYVTRWNSVAERLTGYSADEVVGRHVGAMAGAGRGPTDDYEKVLQLAAQGGRLELERDWFRRDGTAFPGLGRITAIRGERGDLLGFVVVVRSLEGEPGAGGVPAAEWSRPFHSSLFALHPEPVAAFDAEARFVDANPAWEPLVGVPAGELPGTSFLSLVVPEDRRRVLDAFRHASRGETQRLRTTLAAGGERAELGLTCFPRPAGGDAVGVWAVGRAPEDEEAPSEEPSHDEAFFRALVEGSADLFFYALDEGRRVRYVSPSVRRVLGYDPEELAGVALDALLDPAEGPAGGGARTRVAAVRHREGRRVLLELAESAPAAPAGALGFARDVTAARERDELLLRGALQDPLTGLPNRALFLDRLGQAARRAARRPDERHAVLLVDLDRFELVNDAMGRELGDALLVEVARRLRRCVRPGDTLCRLRGDEFAVLLEGLAGPEGAIRVAERVQHSLASPFRVRSHELLVGASVGIALGGAAPGTPGGGAPEDTLRDAAAALGEARAAGGARYRLAGAELRDGVGSRAELEEELRRAIDRNELALVYQPVVSLRTGDVSGFEALVRWRHPERGTVSPADFLPLAEDTGLILAVDRWVLREACRQLRAWQDEFPDRECRISVNLSGRQLASPGAADRIQGVLDECEVAAPALGVEVREDALVEGEELSAAVLQRIHALGVRVQIDDFGTGSGSLTRLRRVPAQALKIDPSLLDGDETVRAAVRMAHSLELSAVAEGIETTEQLDHLRAMGFDYGQGFLFSEPVDGDLAGLLLDRRLPL